MNRFLVTAAACAALLVTGAAQAATTPEQKCQTSKIKAQGKLQACLKKQSAGVLLGKSDESAECHTKFQAALAKIDAKATAAGTSCRILDHGDGTLSDLDTGLMWEEKLDEAGPHNWNTVTVWATPSGTTVPNGSTFTSMLGTLNTELSADGSSVATPCFAGHCDWRLPSIVELETLVDLSAPGCGSGGACIIEGMGLTQDYFHYSGTSLLADPTDVWGIDFATGTTSSQDKALFAVVRAVRGGF